MKRPLLVLLMSLLPTTEVAALEIQTGRERWPGKNELSASTGFQAGLNTFGTNGASPGGFKVLLDYSFRFHEVAWLDFGVGFLLGGSCDPTKVCGDFASGNTVEPSAGLKLKFPTSIPLVPYAKLDATVVAVYNRPCADNGVVIGGRVGGGLRYFLLPSVGLGVETTMVAGPAFFQGNPNCRQIPSHSELWATFELQLGGEFIF